MQNAANFKCGFQRRTPQGLVWSLSDLIVVDTYTGVCVTPDVPEADVGWTRIGLSLDAGNTFPYQDDVYFGVSRNGGPLYTLLTESGAHFWLSTQPTGPINVSWSPELMFGVAESLPVELYVVGFKGNETVFSPLFQTCFNNPVVCFFTF